MRGKSKRKIVLPERFRAETPDSEGKKKFKTNTDDKYLNFSFPKKDVKQSIIERRLFFCTKESRKENRTLSDVFIWCCIHKKYDCHCSNPLIYVKTNALIWKPQRKFRYLARKNMFEIPLSTFNDVDKSVLHYDREEYSARTFGSIYDFKTRNKESNFKAKRKCEMDNFQISSNSFVKMKYHDLVENINKNNIGVNMDNQDEYEYEKVFLDSHEEYQDVEIISEDENDENFLKKDERKNNNDPDWPDHGLLCLTPGIGYLPLIDFTKGNITIADFIIPVSSSFQNVYQASSWINNNLQKLVQFETNTKLEWIIVTRGILKSKNIKPFDFSMLYNENIIITNSGVHSLV